MVRSIGRLTAAVIVAGINARVASQQASRALPLARRGRRTVRRLTTPKASTDQAPHSHPTGTTGICVVCAARSSPCDVYVLDLDPAFAPIGPGPPARPRRPWRFMGSPGVAMDNRSFMTAETVPLRSYLWRVDVDGRDPPSANRSGRRCRLREPATAPSRDRLVFSRRLLDADVYGMALGQPPQPVAASSFHDFMPQFSPDGRRMVFCSTRSGESVELWIASADGSGAQQLTRGMGRCRARGAGRQMADRSRSTPRRRRASGTSGSSIRTVEHRGRSRRIPAVKTCPDMVSRRAMDLLLAPTGRPSRYLAYASSDGRQGATDARRERTDSA